jgi:hypothetical protein
MTAALGAALALALVAWACGDSNSPTEPTPPPSTGGPGASSITITLTSAGASASATDLAVGGTVTVVNNDGVSHEMSSDPHPAHTNCPGLNFGPLAPGQSRTSAALSTARSCGMHDHANPGTQSLMRTITIR